MTSTRDTLVRDLYLMRFSWAMQDFPKYKKVVRELRSEIDVAASEVGMRQAVADLGHPRVLADSYLSGLGRPLPRWTAGAVWGALAVGAVAYLAVAYALGTIETIEQMGGGTLERVFLGATTTFVAEGGALAVESTFTWQVLVFYALVFTVPFLLGARVWRAWAGSPAPARAAHA
jgi:hypothetical protein